MQRERSLFTTTMVLACALVALAAVVIAAPLVPVQAGGELGDALVVGDIAYYGQGATISVWQLSSDGSAAPVRVGVTDVLPGIVRGLAVSGGYLFASWYTQDPYYGELIVFSLADPTSPERVLDFAYSTGSFLRPGDMVVIGDSLILTDPDSGVYSIDISDPLAPTVDTMLYSYSLRHFAITGTHLVGWGAGFMGFSVEVFDVSNPAVPASVGYYSSWGVFENAAVDGDLMLLVGDGMEVVSLASPAMPAWVATVPSAGSFFRSALLVGDLAYIGDANGVQVWDFSTPATPVAGTIVTAPADRTELAALHSISGGVEAVMFTARGRGLTLDLGTPASPVLEHVFDLPIGSDSTDVAALDGNTVLTTDFYSGLRISDGDLDDLGRVDPDIQQGGFEGVAVSGTTAYMVSWGYGLHTIDVADPALPTELASLPFPYASALDVNGSIVYVVTSTNGGVFYAADVTNPSAPVTLGSLAISHGVDVVYHDGMALVADQNSSNGLLVIDVGDPNNPVQLGAYSGCGSGSGVAARGDLAYLACSDGSLHVVSLADPSMPTQLGVYTDSPLYASGQAAEVDGDVVWFGHSSGVDLLDVSDPTVPTRIERVWLAAAVRGMDVGDDGNGWVAAGLGGVYRVEPVVFRDGFESGDLGAWYHTVQ